MSPERDAGLSSQRANRLTRSTAEGAALLRATGRHVRDRDLRGPDTLAADLIAPGLGLPALVKLPGVGRVLVPLVERLLPGGLWFEIARSRGMDDVIAEELAAGLDQLVILGAGLDSRAYRMALDGVTVFEVDHPSTAAYKRERVAAVIGTPPANVRYVEIDFAVQDIAAELAAAGFDAGRRSLVLWSGVAPYLPPEVVDETLAWFATLAPGNVIVFDYLWSEFLDGACDDMPGAVTLRKRVESNGEPFLSGLPRGGTREFLAERGLELVEDLDAQTAEQRYCTRPDGTKAGWLWGFGGFARARVPR